MVATVETMVVTGKDVAYLLVTGEELAIAEEDLVIETLVVTVQDLVVEMKKS